MGEKAKIEVNGENVKALPVASGKLTVSAITQVGELAERAMSAYYAVLRDALELVRETATRADKLVLDAVDTGESLSVGAVRSTRETILSLTTYATRTTRLWTTTARETLPPTATA